MSGNAFKDTSPISLDELENIWSGLVAHLAVAGLSRITPIGTTWKKEVMGDVDLAGMGDESSIIEGLQHVFGEQNVRRVGGRLFSIRYPVAHVKRHVQVDVIVGEVYYLSWSRFGPSTMKSHGHYSPVKGVIRNLFLNTILRETTTRIFDGGLDRVRETLDFDLGLYHASQTRRGVNGRELKKWTTHISSGITSNPDEIVKRIFGHGTANDALTFEDCLLLAKNSGKFDMAKLKDAFVNELSDIVMTNPKTLGQNLVDPIKYVKDECKW